MRDFGSMIPLGAGYEPARAAIVRELPGGKGAKPEQIFRGWADLAEQRIVAEQLLLSDYQISAPERQVAGDGGLFAVLGFLDAQASTLFAGQVDAGELSNYMAADARRWRDLLRALRQRSTAAKDTPRYHQLTRALAAAEFLASEPIGDAERQEFALGDIGADLDENRRTAEISANFLARLRQPKPTPNIAICLRDANGDVCGEAVFAAPIPEANGQRDELFTATLRADREIANVEVSLTRRAVG
ncbi:MAG: hypothetical protein AB7Q23_10815 [Hyphomonadaceae bacterium]